MPSCPKVEVAVAERGKLVAVGVGFRALAEAVEAEGVEGGRVRVDSRVLGEAGEWREEFCPGGQVGAVREGYRLYDLADERGLRVLAGLCQLWAEKHRG